MEPLNTRLYSLTALVLEVWIYMKPPTWVKTKESTETKVSPSIRV
jgi:hypothetical protein